MNNNKTQVTYEVVLSKSFIYPKGMLSSTHPQEDATEKAYFDIHKTIDEYAHNKFEQINIVKFFEAKVIENKGFKVKDSEEESSNKVSIGKVIDHLAQQEFENKHGVMNVEENPELFEFAHDQWYLKEDLNNIYDKLRQKYRKLLYKFTQKEEKQPRHVTLGQNRRFTTGNALEQLTGNNEPSSYNNLRYNNSAFTWNIVEPSTRTTSTNIETPIEGQMREDGEGILQRYVRSNSGNNGEWLNQSVWDIWSLDDKEDYRQDLDDRMEDTEESRIGLDELQDPL